MTLQKFLTDSSVSTSAFARAMGITQPHAWRIVHKPDDFRPSAALALKIEAWSGGKVKAASLSPLVASITKASAEQVQRLGETSPPKGRRDRKAA